METFKVKDFVYSHNNNTAGFITNENPDNDGNMRYDIQHPFEWNEKLSEKENTFARNVAQSVAYPSELTKIKVK